MTSWRKDGKDTEPVAHAGVELAGKGSHAVLIVDTSSGSMKKNDVPGYKSRGDAVYQCLIRDFVKEQVSTGAGADVVVSLITMGDEANTVITTQPLDESLITELERIGKRSSRSHENCVQTRLEPGTCPLSQLSMRRQISRRSTRRSRS